MEVSLKFTAGETGAEIVAAVIAVFGNGPALNANQATAIVTHGAPATHGSIAPIDNPAAGADPEDVGPTNNATHDTEGSPWDARIHSDKRTVTDKGVWRKRKGTPPHQITAVQNELRAAGKYAAIGMPPVAPAPVAAPAMPTMPTAPATVPTMPTMPPVESAYTKFATFVASNLNSPANPQGRLTGDWVSQALASFGYAGTDGAGYMAMLEKEPADKVLAVHTAFANALGVAV